MSGNASGSIPHRKSDKVERLGRCKKGPFAVLASLPLTVRPESPAPNIEDEAST